MLYVFPTLSPTNMYLGVHFRELQTMKSLKLAKHYHTLLLLLLRLGVKVFYHIV